MNYKWNYSAPTEEDLTAAQLLAERVNISPVIARMLINRGITTEDDARRFFRPQLHDLHDPFLMTDMDKAVERLNEAMGKKERILIYGDYDVDGICATSIMTENLRAMGADVGRRDGERKLLPRVREEVLRPGRDLLRAGHVKLVDPVRVERRIRVNRPRLACDAVFVEHPRALAACLREEPDELRIRLGRHRDLRGYLSPRHGRRTSATAAIEFECHGIVLRRPLRVEGRRLRLIPHFRARAVRVVVLHAALLRVEIARERIANPGWHRRLRHRLAVGRRHALRAARTVLRVKGNLCLVLDLKPSA